MLWEFYLALYQKIAIAYFILTIWHLMYVHVLQEYTQNGGFIISKFSQNHKIAKINSSPINHLI